MSRPVRSHLVADVISLRLPDGRSLFSSLTIGVANERIGLVGPNGSGKSSLLEVLAGIRAPGEGRVHHNAPIGYLTQRQPRHDHLTVGAMLGVAGILAAIQRAEDGVATIDDVALIGDHWTLPERLRVALAEVGLAHLPLDRPMSGVSGGEATRLALAARLLDNPRVLLLDEPTNDLDADSQMAVYALVERWPYGMVVASHDRALLNRMDRMLELSGGAARWYGGGYDAYHEQVLAERSAAQAERDHAAAMLRRTRRELQAVRERKAQSDAKGRKSRSTGSQPSLVLNAARERSQHTGARLQETAARLVDAAQQRLTVARDRADSREPLKIELPSTELPAGTTVVSLRDVSVGPPGASALLHHITVDMVGPARLAVVGANGSGKTTLLRVIAGHNTPLSGTVHRGVPLDRVAFLDQHAAVLDGYETVLDAFSARHPHLDTTATRDALAQFHFRTDAVHQRIDTLSGGERMRAALACVLAGDEPPRLLVLDEPTNHLDLDSIGQLEAAICGYDGALAVASHDATFLSAIGITALVDVSKWRQGRSGVTLNP
jgi:ATPase subunit of ABC transporter with duplicated ATPase domains